MSLYWEKRCRTVPNLQRVIIQIIDRLSLKQLGCVSRQAVFLLQCLPFLRLLSGCSPAALRQAVLPHQSFHLMNRHLGVAAYQMDTACTGHELIFGNNAAGFICSKQSKMPFSEGDAPR